MSSNFAFDTRDIKFILKEWLPTDEIFEYDKYKGYYSREDLDMSIDQIYRICADMIAPTNEDGEKNPVRFENGKVILPPTFPKLYKYIQENGWATANVDEEAEGTIPEVIQGLVSEMLTAANPAFVPYLGLTSGAARLIQSYGQQEDKEKFLPKMREGTWSGTMCLTEPTAGSDVGDILSRAYPTDVPRIYKIKGNKIFITGGDGDHVENLIHLYLARIEGSKPGTKGISLFIVPKFWVNDDGSMEPNDVECTGVEHKLGLKGSATAALAFGDNNNCRGILLGSYNAETGEGQGMAQMFQMMNEERMGVGCMTNGVTANAYWNAVKYAKERVQGRPLTDMRGKRVFLIEHEDIKRMLLHNKAITEACRALNARTYYYIDVRHLDPDPAKREWADNRIECMVPMCKAYASDEAWSLICDSIQVHGGYGYCEDYPVAQAARDVKINSIWEGTNFIQSLDLIGRKWTAKGGQLFAEVLKDIEDFINEKKDSAAGLEKEFANLEKALGAYREIQGAILTFFTEGKINMMPVYSRRILTATAQLFAGWLLLDQALLAQKRAAELGESHFDYSFYKGKVLSARYYLRNVVPNVWWTLEVVKEADTSVLEADSLTFDH
ncbi:MAG: acyl-CoA dehydrogenase [Chitinophagales bacterium]